MEEECSAVSLRSILPPRRPELRELLAVASASPSPCRAACGRLPPLHSGSASPSPASPPPRRDRGEARREEEVAHATSEVMKAAWGNRGGFFVRPRWNLLSRSPHRGRSERERTPGSEGFAFGLQPYLMLSSPLALLARIFKCIQQMNNAQSSPECAKFANTAFAAGTNAP